MQKLTLFWIASLLLLSCGQNDKGPDISGIQVKLPVERFEEGFFAIDTLRIPEGLTSLQARYPEFYPVFMTKILGVSGNPADEPTLQITRIFLRGYGPIRDSLRKRLPEFSRIQPEIEKGFRYLKYYFPEYKTGKLVTFIGPLDAPGVALLDSGLAIGLQQYAGKDFSVYQNMAQQQIFPDYISRRFEPQYIPVSCLNVVLTELFPDRSNGRPLVEQMVERGKRWYLLDQLFPETPDSIKTGYTNRQLDWCEENEGNIWSYVVQNEDLNTIDPVAIQTYIGEAPFTQGLPEASPGNIGQWIGWQIVKKYAAEHKVDLKALLAMEARKLLEEAKYKPK